MVLKYIVSRLAMFFISIFVASTVIFFLPRLTGQNPLEEKFYQEAQRGGYLEDVDEIVAAFEEQYGFDKPLYQQYFTFMVNLTRFDLGRSIFSWPKTVNQLLGETIIWTLALSLLTGVIAFVIGTIMGALMEWKRNNSLLMVSFFPFMIWAAVPYFIFGLVLLTVFSFAWPVLPGYGGYQTGIVGWPNWSELDFLVSVVKHGTLPALSIILVSLAGWAMGMRGMMVTTKGEDYMLLAEAKGLPGRVQFYRYAVRNSTLPQLTGLALQLGLIVSGLLLVEVVFAYPGVGGMLYSAIRISDHAIIQGTVFVLAFGTALATLILDMIYPLIDPRIKYGAT